MSKMPLAPGDRTAEWLQECMPSWRFQPIKYLCSINNRVLPETTSDDTEIEYIDISSVDSLGNWKQSEPMIFSNAPSRARRVLVDGDVIISTVRTYLKAIAYVDRVNSNLICSTGFAVLSGGKHVHSKFLAYWVRSSYFVDEIVSRSVGVSYPAINASDIGSLPFPVLDIIRQRAIAAFLDRETERIDLLIAKKERQIELLQEKRTALISQAVTKGLNPKAKMKDSGIEWLGAIPQHWKLIPLKLLLAKRGDAIKTGPFGSQLLSSEMLTGEVKVYNQRNVIYRNFQDGDNYITTEKYDELKAFTIMHGDILVTTRGTIGRCALFPAGAEEGVLHPCLMRIQTDESKMLREYLAMLIQDGTIIKLQLSLMSNATTIEVIYSESLKQVLIPMPPISEQQDIAKYLDEQNSRHDTMVEKIQRSINLLEEYRMALISAAVTGKIDVREEAA